MQFRIDCQYKLFQGLARHLQQGGAEKPGDPVIPAGALQPGDQEILQGAVAGGIALDHRTFEENSLCSMAISHDGHYTSTDGYITSNIYRPKAFLYALTCIYRFS